MRTRISRPCGDDEQQYQDRAKISVGAVQSPRTKEHKMRQGIKILHRRMRHSPKLVPMRSRAVDRADGACDTRSIAFCAPQFSPIGQLAGRAAPDTRIAPSDPEVAR